MPNRIIREGLIDSPKIDLLSAEEERFFLRLMLKADDFGRYSANPIVLKNTLFPLKESVRSTDSSRWLAACEKAGLVRLYETPKGRFLEIREFKQRQRADESKFPSPDEYVAGHVGLPSDISQTIDGPLLARASTSPPTTSSPPKGSAEGGGKSKADLETVQAFCKEEGIKSSDAEWFFHKCEGTGWTNGGRAIKDWKGTLRAWKAASYLPSQKVVIAGSFGGKSSAPQASVNIGWANAPAPSEPETTPEERARLAAEAKRLRDELVAKLKSPIGTEEEEFRKAARRET